MTVFRDVREAGVAARLDGKVRDLAAADVDASGADGAEARECVEQLRLAVPLHACDAEDLAGLDGEAHAIDGDETPRVFHDQLTHAQQRLRWRGMRTLGCGRGMLV